MTSCAKRDIVLTSQSTTYNTDSNFLHTYSIPPQELLRKKLWLIFAIFLLLWMNCRSDEIGNRTRLKIVRRKACGFESHLRHLSIAKKPTTGNLTTISYIIGVAIGDGNLSNPSGRAVRLRITCDIKYPNIIKNITQALQEVMPNNKVSVVNKKENCVDISCYSNKWENLLG